MEGCFYWENSRMGHQGGYFGSIGALNENFDLGEYF